MNQPVELKSHWPSHPSPGGRIRVLVSHDVLFPLVWRGPMGSWLEQWAYILTGPMAKLWAFDRLHICEVGNTGHARNTEKRNKSSFLEISVKSSPSKRHP